MSHHALDGQKPGGNGHIEVHHVLLTAMGMDMEGQRFARPRHFHACGGLTEPAQDKAKASEYVAPETLKTAPDSARNSTLVHG